MNNELQETDYGYRIGHLDILWAQNSKEFFFANSLVFEGKEPILVDPSANFTYFQQLAALKIPVRVVNSHYHTDHRTLNNLFKNATFLAHGEDIHALKHWEKFQDCIDGDPTSPYSEWARLAWPRIRLPGDAVTMELKDGDILENEYHQIKVVHLPGHTPGLIGLHVPDIELLFTSDIDLTPGGPWYSNEASDIDQFIDSIKKVREIEANYYVTSHGQRVYSRELFLERIANYEAHFGKRDEKILEALKEGPLDAAGLSEKGIIFYRKATDPLKAYFSTKMVEKHLVRLEKKGRIRRDGDRYRLA